MNSPLVSICLCTYNGAQYLVPQLESILQQSYSNFELIVVDDCSRDNTIAILEQFAAADARIKLFKNEKNLGFLKNFEKSIMLANGELIALADQDDIWMPHKIETLLLSIGDHLLVYHDSLYVDKNGQSLHRSLFDHKKYLNGSHPLAFTFNNCITGHTILFKKELKPFLFPFPEKAFHDWWIGYVAMSEGTIVYVDQQLVHYRYHDQNVTDLLGERNGKDVVSLEKIRRSKADECISQATMALNYKNIKEENKLILERVISGYQDRKKSFLFSSTLFKVLWKAYPELLLLKEASPFKLKIYVFKESLGEGVKDFFHTLKIMFYRLKD